MARKLFWLAAILIVAAAFATGLFSWSKIQSRAQLERYRLQSKIQSLSAGSSQQEAQWAAGCRANLRRIESAKRALASRGSVNAGAVSWDAVLREMRSPMPKCPKGGEYRLGTLEQLPTCSIGANGTAEKQDDHKIGSF